MSQHGQRGHGDESYLVVAVVRPVAVALADCAVHPSALRYAGGEQVFEVKPEGDVLDNLAGLQAVTQTHVGKAVFGKRPVLILAVVQMGLEKLKMKLIIPCIHLRWRVNNIS